MAEFETALYASQDPARVNITRLAPPNVAGGDVEFAVVPYVLDGGEVGSDTIKLALLPAGAIPVPQLTSVACSNPGTALALEVGNADNADAWGNFTLSAGGEVRALAAGMPSWVSPTPLVADNDTDANSLIIATVSSATSLTPGVTVYFLLAYKRGR